MEIKLINISDIKPYKNNPRINIDAVEKVANSIKEFGFKVPIVVNENYVIINGHTRYEASKLLGLKKLPCIIANDLNEEKQKAFRIVDNKTHDFAEWDFDLLDEELDKVCIDMNQFGFDDGGGIDFIDEMLNSGIAGDGYEKELFGLPIRFNNEDEALVKRVINGYGKNFVVEEVMKEMECD
jgi:hypothetical protein